ncbi:MaoC family protein [Caballeronia arvi]|uniref:MaoC family protein n=1 Tax=Caballeronia arvi TaxID=1777135 RepID=A0A158JA03_9BURK|nr:acyl dehydratase [Caballeronia arvi]SAL65722.1 MaoC family protein [Caballeronia arvi]
MPIILSGVDGIRACLGFHLGHSDWIEIDQATIERFESLTDDRAAGDSGAADQAFVPCSVMLAMLIPLLQQIYMLEDTLNVTLHGIEQLQFVKPVPTGSGLRVGATVKAVQPAGDHWQLNFECAMECDVLAGPVMRASVLYRFRPASVAGMPHLSLCTRDLSCR